GLARTEPRPGPAELAYFYEGHYFNCVLGMPNGDGPMPARQRVSRIRRALSRVLAAPYHARYGPTGVPGPPRPGAAMLEIGPGDELAEHARRGWEVWAVEPSPAAARAVAARIGMPPHRMIVAAAEDARLPHRRFDRVVMSHVIEHLSDPRSVVQRVHAAMRPD